MLEKLKAKLGMVEAVATVTDATLQAAFEASEAKVLELSSQIAEYTSVLFTMETKLDAAEASLVKYAELAAQAEAAQAEMEAKALTDRNEARMSQLSAAVGDVKASALFAAFGGSDDNTFSMLVESMQMALDKEAKGEMFSEVGVEGAEASVSPEDVNKAAFSAAIKQRKSKGIK